MNRDEAVKWCYDRDFLFCFLDWDGGVVYFEGGKTLRKKFPEDREDSERAKSSGFNPKYEGRKEENADQY